MVTRTHVGDRVLVPLVQGKATGIVTEDRGPIGRGGRHLFQIEVAIDPFDSFTVELPEDEFEAGSELNQPEPLSRDEIVEYLTAGGLIAILRLNYRPLVWLCRDTLGNVTYTFSKERGLSGGESVPCNTLRRGRLFPPEHPQVLAFLKECFHLSDDDASDVVRSVEAAR